MLIENSGFQRGDGLARGSRQVAISTKHALALTNRGGATTSELLGLAAEIRAGVEHSLGLAPAGGASQRRHLLTAGTATAHFRSGMIDRGERLLLPEGRP